ncbi:MAG: preprotein translocase subunit YajC [Velocimicrobium sp.]
MSLFPVLASTSTGGLAITVVYIVALVGIFYFFMIRPQKKQQKAHEVLLTTIAIGDSILTSSGFYGVVIDVTDDVVIVEFGSNKNCRIPMKKDAIVEIEKAGGVEN